MDNHQVFQLHVAQYDHVSRDVRQFLRTEDHLAALHNAESLRTRVLTLLNNAETVRPALYPSIFIPCLIACSAASPRFSCRPTCPAAYQLS